MNIGRRHNADPRWILPLLCRRGHLTRNEIGAIRILPSETQFQVPRAIAAKFVDSIARTANQDTDEGAILIIPSDAARQDRSERRPEPRNRPTLSRAPQSEGPRPARPAGKPPFKRGPKKPGTPRGRRA
jgi:ATP-dependent RNA helicase DeaD